MRKRLKFTTVILSTVVGTTMPIASFQSVGQANNLTSNANTRQAVVQKTITATPSVCQTAQTTEPASKLSQMGLNRYKENIKNFQQADRPGGLEKNNTIKSLKNCKGGVTESIPHTPKLSSSEQPTQDTKQQKSGKRGLASWYGPGFHGGRTASGESFNSNGLTAAHRSLPFGTKVKVTNLNNGRSVVVRINDRGPHSGGRLIDLSAGAARLIGVVRSGVAPVLLEVLGR